MGNDMDATGIAITSEMVKLIGEIDEFKGAWKAFQNLAPDRLNLLRKVATVESVASFTRIEGAKLTDAEVERLLSGVGLKRYRSRDEQEVAGYLYVPYASLERVVEENRDSYYLALRRSQATLHTDNSRMGDWLLFFLQSLTKRRRIGPDCKARMEGRWHS